MRQAQQLALRRLAPGPRPSAVNNSLSDGHLPILAVSVVFRTPCDISYVRKSNQVPGVYFSSATGGSDDSRTPPSGGGRGSGAPAGAPAATTGPKSAPSADAAPPGRGEFRLASGRPQTAAPGPKPPPGRQQEPQQQRQPQKQKQALQQKQDGASPATARPASAPPSAGFLGLLDTLAGKATAPARPAAPSTTSVVGASRGAPLQSQPRPQQQQQQQPRPPPYRAPQAAAGGLGRGGPLVRSPMPHSQTASPAGGAPRAMLPAVGGWSRAAPGQRPPQQQQRPAARSGRWSRPGGRPREAPTVEYTAGGPTTADDGILPPSAEFEGLPIEDINWDSYAKLIARRYGDVDAPAGPPTLPSDVTLGGDRSLAVEAASRVVSALDPGHTADLTPEQSFELLLAEGAGLVGKDAALDAARVHSLMTDPDVGDPATLFHAPRGRPSRVPAPVGKAAAAPLVMGSAGAGHTAGAYVASPLTKAGAAAGLGSEVESAVLDALGVPPDRRAEWAPAIRRETADALTDYSVYAAAVRARAQQRGEGGGGDAGREELRLEGALQKLTLPDGHVGRSIAAQAVWTLQNNFKWTYTQKLKFVTFMVKVCIAALAYSTPWAPWATPTRYILGKL